jgi:hypothetical protein
MELVMSRYSTSPLPSDEHRDFYKYGATCPLAFQNHHLTMMAPCPQKSRLPKPLEKAYRVILSPLRLFCGIKKLERMSASVRKLRGPGKPEQRKCSEEAWTIDDANLTILLSRTDQAQAQARTQARAHSPAPAHQLLSGLAEPHADVPREGK